VTAAATKARSAKKKQPRALWNGSVVFGEVAVPVSVQVARQREDVSFVLLHRGCGARIVQPKRCSRHNRSVKPSEIVKGFEFATGHYVEIEDSDLASGDEAKTILLDRFVPPDERLLLHVDSTYYLAPRGGEGDAAAYALLLAALGSEQLAGLGAIVMYGREYACAVYPLAGVLCLSTLFLSADVRSTVPIRRALKAAPERELLLARKFVAGQSREFNPKLLRSGHGKRIRALIEGKVRDGRGLVEAPGASPLDLEKALRESLKLAARKRGSK